MENWLALASEARGFIRHQSTALHKAMSFLILNAFTFFVTWVARTD
jgi:hypothetical protein